MQIGASAVMPPNFSSSSAELCTSLEISRADAAPAPDFTSEALSSTLSSALASGAFLATGADCWSDSSSSSRSSSDSSDVGLVGAGLDLAGPLGRRVDAHEGAGVEVEVVEGQTTEDVVHDRLRHAHVRVVRQTGRLEAQVGELLDEGLERHAVLQADRDGDREGVHHAGQGRALLAELEEDLAELRVVVGAGREVALGATDGERGRLRGAALGQTATDRAVLDDLLDLDLGGRSVGGVLVLGGGIASGLVPVTVSVASATTAAAFVNVV